MNLELGFGLLDGSCFYVALSPFVCVCVMFRISMRLWSYPFFSIHFECYVVQFNHPLAQVNMPLVAWLLSHPIFLESFEDTAFLDQCSNTGGFSNLETDEKQSLSTYVMT